MNNSSKNLSTLANRFKVEELKQRIEFDIAMEELDADSSSSDGWKDRKTSAGVEMGLDGKPKVVVKVSW